MPLRLHQWSEEAVRIGARPLVERCPETFCDAASPCDDCLNETREALDNAFDVDASAITKVIAHPTTKPTRN